jgi:hypothetical protein
MISVAKALPTTFGGFWYDDEGRVVVGLTDPSALRAAIRLIRPWLGESQPTSFVAQTVQYPFLQLAAYRTLLRREVFSVQGVVVT